MKYQFFHSLRYFNSLDSFNEEKSNCAYDYARFPREQSVAYSRDALGHGPPLSTIFFPFCVSTSGQRKFGPPFFEILNTPLGTVDYILLHE